LPLQPKKYVAGLKAGIHGGTNYAEFRTLGIKPEEILDFSVSTNPFMPPPGIREIIQRVPVEKYPDSQSTELTERLAARLEIAPEKILVGSGTTELIRLIALAYFRQHDTVLILEPTYGEYEVACRISGARTLKYRALEKDGFAPDTEKVVNLIRERRPRAVFICNPNNPTGQYLPRAEVEKILKACRDTLLVLDEAYVTFVKNARDPLDLTERFNLIVLRSMTKDYGLPGLRLGYAVASRQTTDVLRAIMPPWSVNVIAQEAGKAVLKFDDYLRDTLAKVSEAKSYLTGQLAKLGLKIVPSDAHYFLVKVGDAPKCRRALLQKGIMVRDCTSFGLPEYIRISPCTLPECQKLIKAVKEIN
jgi:histidinol-phosphate aminotransferase